MFSRVNPNDPLGMIHFSILKVKISYIHIDEIFDIQIAAFCNYNILTLRSAGQISGPGHPSSQFVIFDKKVINDFATADVSLSKISIKKKFLYAS